MKFKAGNYAQRKNWWKVVGNNLVRQQNMKEAIRNADKVLVNSERAKQLIDQLTGYSDEELGGLATVDFAGRALSEVGQSITPDNIRKYFASNWHEKTQDPWYTPENIIWAAKVLADLGLYRPGPSGANEG